MSKIEDVLPYIAEKWRSIPAVPSLCGKIDVLIGDYEKLRSSRERSGIRKIWNSLAAYYWNLFSMLVGVALDEGGSSGNIDFDDYERLFLNAGFLSRRISSSEKCFDLIEQKMPIDIFCYYAMTDLIQENSVLLSGGDCADLPNLSLLEGRMRHFEAQLSSICQRMRLSLMTILPGCGDMTRDKSEVLALRLEENLDDYMEKEMRSSRFREAPKERYEEMVAAHSSFVFAEKEMLSSLDSATREIEGFSDSEKRRITDMHDRAKSLASIRVHLRNEEAVWRRRIERYRRKFGGRDAGELRREMLDLLEKKKEYMALASMTARVDPSPLFTDSFQEPLSFGEISDVLNSLLVLDMEMLRVPRVRMYGIPKVLLVPGSGYGVYDWTDNSLIIPLTPVHGKERTIAHALGSFRWDSDEDRTLKDGYSRLKENRHKSIRALGESFCNDYYLWLIKERRGYRVLPRETRKWFMTAFGPSASC